MKAAQGIRPRRWFKPWASGAMDRHQAGLNAELDRARALLRHSQALAKVGGWEVDVEAGTLFWTDEIFRIHELNPATYRPTVESALQFYALEGRLVMAQALQRAIDTGENFDLDLELITGKGRRLWIHSASQVITREGKVVKVLGAFRDISEERLAAERLAKSQAVLAGIMECAEGPTFSVDQDYRYTSFNQAHARVMKALYGTDITLGSCLLDQQTVPEDRASTQARLGRALNGEAFMEEAAFGEEGSSRRHFGLAHMPIRDAGGQVTGVATFARDITKRRNAEEAFKATEGRALTMLQTTQDGVWLLGKDGTFEDMNAAGCRMTGYTLEELKGMGVSDLKAEDAHEETQDYFSRLTERGSGVFESILRHKDGTAIPVEVSVTAIPESGQWVAFVRDISARQQAEATLRRTAQLLSQSEAVAGVGGWEVDLVTQTVYWTDQTYRIHELERATHTPTVETGLQFYAPESRPAITQAVQEAIETGRNFDLELELITAKGRRIWVHTVGRTLLRDGVVVKVLGAFQDITERKVAEDALRESERRYCLISENTEDVIWVMDVAQGRLSYVSPSVERVRGYKPKEVMAEQVEDFLTPESRRLVLETMVNRLPRYEAGDEACRVTVLRLELSCRDGSTVPIEVVCTLLKDANGRVSQVLGVSRDIRARVESERRLADSERRHRTVFETSAAGLILVDRETLDILDANRAFCEMYGYSVGELQAMKAMDVSAEPEATAQAILSGEMNIKNRMHRRKDGSVFPVEVVIKTFQEGTRAVWVGSVRDITARLKEEKAIRDRMEQLQVLLELASLPEGYAGKELLREGLERSVRLLGSKVGFLHLVLEDQETLALTTWTADTLKGCTAQFDSHYPIAEAGIWADAVRTHRPVIHNDYPERKDRKGLPEGHFPLTREVVIPVVENGQVRMILGVGNKPADYDDIDVGLLEIVAGDLWKSYARQVAVGELKASETSLRATFDQVLVGIAHLSLDGRVVRLNQRFAEIVGREADQLVGANISSITHPKDQLPPGAAAEDILRGRGGSLTHEKRYLKPDGTFVWVQLMESLVEPGGAEPGYILKVVEDITERKRIEAELQNLQWNLERRVDQRTHQLAAANQDLEAFAYSVSHDLRAPLRAISGFSEALIRDEDSSLSPKGVEHLQRVQGGANRMAQLIEDLLKLSRIGRDDYTTLPLDLGGLAEQVLAGLQAVDPDRQITFQVQRPIPVLGDPRLLRILLENLLGNAWKFTSRTPEARITVAARPLDAATVEISIRDNGAGFPSAQAGKLFAPFHRLHRAEEFPGTGIGLAIAKRIVSRHEGMIRAEGHPGAGAAVLFTLPSAQQEQP